MNSYDGQISESEKSLVKVNRGHPNLYRRKNAVDAEEEEAQEKEARPEERGGHRGKGLGKGDENQLHPLCVQVGNFDPSYDRNVAENRENDETGEN